MTTTEASIRHLNVTRQLWYRDCEGYPRPTSNLLEKIEVVGTWSQVDDSPAQFGDATNVWCVRVAKVGADGNIVGKAKNWTKPAVLKELEALRKCGVDIKLLGWNS